MLVAFLFPSSDGRITIALNETSRHNGILVFYFLPTRTEDPWCTLAGSDNSTSLFITYKPVGMVTATPNSVKSPVTPVPLLCGNAHLSHPETEAT
jgi:hypothetical protein